MVFYAYLKIDGIMGESTDSKHKDYIDIISFRYGVNQPSGVAGGPVSGRAEFQDLTIVKTLDKSSPKIFEACANGAHLKAVALEVFDSNKRQFMNLKLTDSTISSYHPGGAAQGGEALPQEEVTFKYSRIDLTYLQGRPDGSTIPATVGFDLKINRQ